MASLSGRAVALMAPRPPGVDPWTPVPRARTTIVVADPMTVIDARRYHLRGNFDPEAFSLDDGRLFLIHYLPADAPTAYRVSVLDLRSGRVWPVSGRGKTAGPNPRMPGIRLRQVYAPDGGQLYTLYTNEPGSTSTDPTGYQGYGSSSGTDTGWGTASRGTTFVHVLDLRDGWAYCADLPKALWDEPAAAEALAASPVSRSLFIVDSIRGLVAELNTRTLRVPRIAHVDLGASVGVLTSAQVSVDGSTLYVGSSGSDGGGSVTAIDVATLTVIDQWPMPRAISGLGLAEDGDPIVAMGNELVTLDPATGRTLGSVAFDGLGSILRVGTPGV